MDSDTSRKTRCYHWNPRGYGRCVLLEGHGPVNNGAGVYYQHSYDRAPGSLGTLDVYEHADPG